jgi:XRE family aerobic/anaerobic benzoate catabolism transcriptional regulator
MTRATLAEAAEVSLRYLADLENGQANASVLLLGQVARALDTPIEDIVSQREPASAQFTLMTQALRELSEDRLREARMALAEFLHPEAAAPARNQRIALIGLRGAGKSSLGLQLAERLSVPFVELNREIEATAGMPVGEIHSLYGQAGYRRLERACLDRAIEQHPRLVLATPGSLVSEPRTYNQLLAHFYTVWLSTSPEQHMARVVAQGDTRPMAGQDEAMSDLKRILEGRIPLYAQADAQLDSRNLNQTEALDALLELLPRGMTRSESAAAMQYSARKPMAAVS